MSPLFAVRYASRNLLRGGQRALLAVACVAFGVMSLVGLQLLSLTISESITVDPRAGLGGDATLARAGRLFTPGDLHDLEEMRAEGAIAAYSLLAERAGPIVKREGTGRARFLGRGVGVEPASYPLVGQVRLIHAPPSAFATRLAEPGSVVITRDVASSLGLATGDEIRLGGGPQGPPSRLRIAGIAELPPDRHGDTAYYSLETAQRLAGRPDVADSAQILWGPKGPSVAALQKAGWTVTTPEDVVRDRSRGAATFGLMLKGAAILGLLLAGIGVSNTMQVLLARRRLEIATLKTLGYSRGHLVLLFGLEAALLGTAGGAIGSLAGAGLSLWLRTLLNRAGAILLDAVLEPRVLLGGVAVGGVTAIIFGLQAIVRASAVRPATLLRDLPTPVAWRETLLLAGVLGTLFSTLAAVVLGSALYGIGVVAGGFVGLALLLVVLGALFLAIVHTPLPLPGLVAVARNNLRRQPVRALIALAALFCGVFTIGFAGAAISSSGRRVAAHRFPADGYNLAIYSKQTEAARLTTALASAGVESVERRILAPAAIRKADGTPLDALRGVIGIDGMDGDRTGSVKLVSGAWPRGENRALAPAKLSGGPWNMRLGDTVEILAAGGASVRLPIAGFYETQYISPLVPRVADLLIPEAMALQLGGSAAQVSYLGKVMEDRLDATSDTLGRAVPEALVMSRADLNSALQGELESVFAFIVAVAGLALVAGAVLIANSVGLAMLERKREMGIFKAIGYSSGRILAGIGVEYAVLGLLAGVTGMGAVAIAFRVINRLRPMARLTLEPAQVPGMIALATAIALLSAIAVAWRPTHVRPLEVLRQE